MARAVERNFGNGKRELVRGDIVMAYFPEVEEADEEMLKEYEDILKHFPDYNLEETEKSSSVQTGVRPAVVVQNDAGNKFSPVIQLSPITSSQSKKSLPTHVSVENLNGTGLTKKSTILAESTRPIDKHFIFGRIGKLNHRMIPNLNRALAIEYGIG